MVEREIFEKYDNLSKDELNKKAAKKFMSEMIFWLVLLNVADVKKKEKRPKKN